MSQCEATPLSDRSVLRITGPDAAKFLQGVITSDLDKVQGSEAIHAGLLTPQGKILFDFFVVGDDGAYLVDVAREAAPDLAKRLGFYRLRAAVEIEDSTGYTVAAVWGGAPTRPDAATIFADPRLAELGFRVLLPDGVETNALGCGETTEAAYHARRIALGVPEGGRDYAFGDAFPHEALFDQLHGVDFDKGCFVGQEVVSRMEHRGTVRKRIVPVTGDGALRSGAEVKAGEAPVGIIGSAEGEQGLALLRLDRAGDALAKGVPLMAEGRSITLHRPAFATFDMPTGKTA